MIKRYSFSFLCAVMVAALIAVLLTLRSQVTPLLFAFGLLFALAPSLLVGLPVIILLHVLKQKSLGSFLLGGLFCGAVLSIWNSLEFREIETGSAILPRFGMVSQSSAVLLLSSLAGALTYWYLVFHRQTRGSTTQVESR